MTAPTKKGNDTSPLGRKERAMSRKLIPAVGCLLGFHQSACAQNLPKEECTAIHNVNITTSHLRSTELPNGAHSYYACTNGSGVQRFIVKTVLKMEGLPICQLIEQQLKPASQVAGSNTVVGANTFKIDVSERPITRMARHAANCSDVERSNYIFVAEIDQLQFAQLMQWWDSYRDSPEIASVSVAGMSRTRSQELLQEFQASRAPNAREVSSITRMSDSRAMRYEVFVRMNEESAVLFTLREAEDKLVVESVGYVIY